jgi:PAS domain S-box-containing protein
VERQSAIPTKYVTLALGGAVFVGLYLSSQYSFVLFHSIAEIFSIVVAYSIFMFTWNSRRFLENHYFLFIGIVSLFIAGIDLVHTLAYKGMNVFSGYDANLPTQLWIASRYLQSISFLIAPWFIHRKLNPNRILVLYTILVAAVLASIFYGIFPDSFIEGQGLTSFKKNSEYFISLLFALSLWLLQRYRHEFDRGVWRLLVGSIGMSIAAEFAFTFYVDVYGFSNLIGHFVKIVAYYLIYKAVIETGLVKPYNLVFRDLQKAEQRYRALFDHSLNGLALCDIITDGQQPVDYIVQEVNHAFESQTGLSARKTIGRRMTDLLPNMSERTRANLKAVSLTGKPVRYEQYSVNLNRYYDISVFSPGEGQVAMILEDVSERKQAEKALQQYTADLEVRNKELDDFAHTVAHDLKNPLGVIMGYTAVLADEPLVQSHELLNYSLSAIGQSAETMNRIVEELLLLSTVRTVDIETCPIEMGSLITNVLRRVNNLVEDNGAEITCSETWPNATGYAPWVEEVWVNYISNAIKYGGEPPNVELGATLQPDGMIRFWVRDNGPGISLEDQSKLFKPFSRLEQTRGSGHGLGLSIVQRIVEKLNGEVGIEGRLGEGSIFSFTLPASLEVVPEVVA